MLFFNPAAARSWHLVEPLRAQRDVLSPEKLQEWRAAGNLTIVKESSHRAVYRLTLPELDVHIKHNRGADWRAAIREAIRPCKAEREFRLARMLRERGIAVPEPLGWAADSDSRVRSSWLISRTCPGVPLSRIPADGADRHVWARRLGQFLAQLHDAGIFHHDLHPDNILAEPDGRLWLLDLHAVRIRRSTSWRRRQDNLVILNRFFSLRASRSERLRFWRAYLASSGVQPTVPGDQAPRELERLTLESNRQFWAARDRRCVSVNRRYRQVCAPGVRGWAVAELSDADLARLRRHPPDLRETAAPLKAGPSSTVVETMVEVAGHPTPAILKHLHRGRRRDRWWSGMRTDPAMRSWINGHALLSRCLPTARPLAVVRWTAGAAAGESCLLTERIGGAIDLRAMADRWPTSDSGRFSPAMTGRIEALGRLLRLFHERGLAHRDLKAPNILTSQSLDEHRFWFIDLVGVERCGVVSTGRRARDLARLAASFVNHPAISRAHRLRFLRGYLNWGLNGRSGWKSWWRRIAERVQDKVARNQRHGRPLA